MILRMTSPSKRSDRRIAGERGEGTGNQPGDPAAAGTVIEKARGQNVPVVSLTKSRLVRRWIATTKPTTWH